eukprot:GCRY01000059.1.p1 GENE.GCRY01000059.1~~GCRY01000059.1.p1  ORF type:complete len:167 (+),score=36.97 GCRY01000059.1:39-503(+)
MKVETCMFSGLKIYPGKGKQYTRADGRTAILLSAKTEAAFKARRNPRKTAWTVVFRRLRRKGTTEEIQKKRTRRVQKFQRGIIGADLEALKAKKNQQTEVRAAQRDAALREAKEKKRAAQAAKKSKKPAQPTQKSAPTAAPKQKMPKQKISKGH